MALPKQVEQQMREVEELERQLQPVADATETDSQPAEPTTEAAVEVPSHVEPVAPVVETKPDVDWESRYRTLDGKYSAEVPRLHQQVKELTQQIQSLAQTLEAKNQPQAKEEVLERLVSEDEEESFGKDLIDVQRRVAREVMREMVNPLKKELLERDAKIAHLEKMLTKTDGDISSMSFEQQLARAVPDFDAINSDPKWVAWLNEVDPFTKEPRRSYASYVYDKGDVAKVKEIVEFYKAATAQPGQQVQKDQRQTELNRQVQPTRTASSSSTASAGERIYTEAEFNRLYDKVRTLNIAGKYEEGKKLDAELSNAMMSGRIRG